MPFCRTGFQINLAISAVGSILQQTCRRLLSEALKEKQIILYSQHLLKKNLIASRIEKNTWNIVKITFSCGNYHIFTFFSCCLPESRKKDHTRGPRAIENGRLFSNSKQNIYVWNLKLRDYRKENKSYLQGVFQLVRGKIFMLIIFSRGPRTTYCTKTK